MGLEWHDRNRDLRGRFDRGYEALDAQIHIRCTPTEKQKIRDAALTDGREISDWCRDVLMQRIRKRLAATRKR